MDDITVALARVRAEYRSAGLPCGECSDAYKGSDRGTIMGCVFCAYHGRRILDEDAKHCRIPEKRKLTQRLIVFLKSFIPLPILRS